MKFDEVKKLSGEDLDKKLQEIKLELMKLNAQVAVGTAPKNTKQIREIKRTLAKMETLRYQSLKKEISEVKKISKTKKYTHK